MKVIDFSIISGNQAVLMVLFADGTMGAATIKRAVSEDFFIASAHRRNFRPDTDAAGFINGLIADLGKIGDIDNLKAKLV